MSVAQCLHSPWPPTYLVVLGWGDGLQVLTGDADNLLTVLQVHRAHTSLGAGTDSSARPAPTQDWCPHTGETGSGLILRSHFPKVTWAGKAKAGPGSKACSLWHIGVGRLDQQAREAEGETKAKEKLLFRHLTLYPPDWPQLLPHTCSSSWAPISEMAPQVPSPQPELWTSSWSASS